MVEISGGPATSNWNQLTVSGHAELSGRLEVVFNAPAAVTCDTWKILSASSVSGAFSEFTVIGAPVGHRVRKFVTSTGVLTLSRESTFADWALGQGLGPGNNGIDDDPDGDGAGNALEMFLGSDPEVAESGLLPGADVTKVDGIDYLSITLPLHAGIMPTDLTLGAVRSTDLVLWSDAKIEIGTASFDEVLCWYKMLFRSKIPLGAC